MALRPQGKRLRIVALTILTGACDNAAASLHLKQLDLADRQLFQDARDVRTKFRKTFPTWFFPVGEDFVTILADWKRELETEHGFSPDDPLFPQTEIPLSANGEVMPPRLKNQCWANADPIRKIFKQACAAAGLPNFRPHSFRHTLAQLADDFCTTPGEYKAWSQNLGHENVLVTLTSYGTVPDLTTSSERLFWRWDRRSDQRAMIQGQRPFSSFHPDGASLLYLRPTQKPNARSL